MDGTGVGVDLSVFYRATDAVDVGVSYKSRTSIDFEGGADFDAPVEFSVKTTDQQVRTHMTIPDKLTMGARWSRDRLAVLADIDVTVWSVNDELVIDFEREETPDPIQTNNWSTTMGLRAGAEYAARETTIVRGGAFYDPSPASTENLAPSSPDSNRVGVTVGASHRVEEHVTIDAFYEYMHLLGRASNNMNALEARYGGHAQLVGVGVRVTR
jgi:long-chain fatty acid transport protein